jgi:LacI family transcriptional regulator
MPPGVPMPPLPQRPNVLLVFITRILETREMLEGIAHFARAHHPWEIFLDDEGRAETDLAWVRSQRWDGVISRHTTPALADACRAMRIPLVDMNDSPVLPGVPKIRPDNAAIGHLGAEHFIERGFHDMAFSGWSNAPWSTERRNGFLEAASLARARTYTLDVEYPGDVRPDWDARQIGVLANWLRSLPKPCAVMACNDLRAVQIMAAARAAGLLVPEDLAVLGANNDVIRCELAYPPLSSVAPDSYQTGYCAAELLDRLMAAPGAASDDLRIEPQGVTVRRSSDVLAISDRIVAQALSVIHENACGGLSVDDLLKRVPASRSQIEKKFRKAIGRSPQAEIRRVQVAKIRQLLAETEFPLKRIAELAGFEHTEYMCVVFKRLTGTSPGAYRKKHDKRARDAG